MENRIRRSRERACQSQRKKCFGTGDGDEEITAIVNLSIDSVTGNTIGKIWYDDRDSIAFNGYDGIVYIKAVVSAAPTPSEPYGRFDISVVEQMNDDGQYAIDGDRFSTMRIVSTGNVFKFAAQTRSVTSVPSDINPAYSSFVTFSSFADRQAKRAAYKSNGGLTTVISYDSMNICFKTALNLPDCYPINDNSATVTVGAYGLYTTDGSRNFSAVTGHTALAIGGATNYYTMPNGFGGPIFVPGSSDPSTGPGLVTSSTAATLNGTPIKVAWLARTVTSTTPVSSGLTMDADTGLLLDPSALGVLIDIRNEIGRLPQEAISTPVRARAGKILE